jgi:hypothetical protein
MTLLAREVVTITTRRQKACEVMTNEIIRLNVTHSSNEIA